MSLLKHKLITSKARRSKLNNRNKIEYLHNQFKKMKAEKSALVEELKVTKNELHVKKWELLDKEQELIGKEEELDDEQKKVNDMKKQIECPVCLDVPRKGPVYTCPNGHLVCPKCKKDSCPTCRVAVGENKSLLAITVIEKVLHNCKFNECQYESTLQEIEQHEESCEHRVVACPKYGQCGQKVPLSKLLDHLHSKPCTNNSVPIVIGESRDSCGIKKYNVPVKVVSTSYMLQGVTTFLFKSFRCALCVRKVGQNWQFNVVMFERPELCSILNIEMEVYESDSSPDTRHSAKVRCHPCSIDEPLNEMKGLGLCVNHRLMERMILKEGNFKFTVSFAFF